MAGNYKNSIFIITHDSFENVNDTRVGYGQLLIFYGKRLPCSIFTFLI